MNRHVLSHGFGCWGFFCPCFHIILFSILSNVWWFSTYSSCCKWIVDHHFGQLCYQQHFVPHVYCTAPCRRCMRTTSRSRFPLHSSSVGRYWWWSPDPIWDVLLSPLQDVKHGTSFTFLGEWWPNSFSPERLQITDPIFKSPAFAMVFSNIYQPANLSGAVLAIWPPESFVPLNTSSPICMSWASSTLIEANWPCHFTWPRWQMVSSGPVGITSISILLQDLSMGLAVAMISSKVDLICRYHQVPIQMKDWDYHYNTCFCLSEFLWMPFRSWPWEVS